MTSAVQPMFQFFEPLPDGEYAALKADIAKRGVLVPIEFDEQGNILDGHHRHRIVQELGIKDYPTVVRRFATDEEKEEHVVTLNVRRRHLSGEQKRKWVAWFLERHPEWTDRRIASEVGVSHPTVAKVRDELESSGEVEKFTTRVGKDGVRQAAEKAKPTPQPSIFTTARNSERAQSVLTNLGDNAPGKQLDLKRAERIARETEAERRRAEPVERVTVTGPVDIRLGDFREILDDIPDGSVDAIITDPPYPRQFWDPYTGESVYVGLARLAQRVLTRNGILAVMTGTRLEMLDAVEAQMAKYLHRRHRAVYLTPGQRWRDQQERVATGYKPILIFSRADADDPRWLNDDVFSSSGTREQDTRFHHWGQSESGFASLVERLTEPGELVLDPFLGGGTTAVVCRDLGRRFIGCDIDAAHVTTSRERVA